MTNVNYMAEYLITTWQFKSNWLVITGSVLIGLLLAGTVSGYEATDTSITISWTVTGDDSLSGLASFYDLRISTTYLDSASWESNSTRRVGGLPQPQSPGTQQTFIIYGLLPNTTYWIGLKIGDEIPNWSDTSNILRAITNPKLAVSVPDSAETVKPYKFQLNQNYPNPFNPTTIISYEIGQSQTVRIDVFNILGQEVNKLVDRRISAGAHQVTWDGRDKSGQPAVSGIYFYRIRAGEFVQTRKMVLLR